MREKGFVVLPILIIILLLGVVGYLIYQNTQLRNSDKADALPTTAPTADFSEPSLTPNPTESWNSYRSTLYSYTMKYPSNWQISETGHGVASRIIPSEENTKTEITNNKSNINIFYEGDWDHGVEPWVFKSSKEVNIGNKVAKMTILTLEGNQSEWQIYTIDNFNNFRIEASVTPTDKDVVSQIISTLIFAE